MTRSQSLHNIVDENPNISNWDKYPWSAAYPIYLWFHGELPEIKPTVCDQPLPSEDLSFFCNAIAQWFLGGPRPQYSSYRVRQALHAVSYSSKSVPEELLKSIWVCAEHRPLDREHWYFYHTDGTMCLSYFRNMQGWDLTWTLATTAPSQVAFRNWIGGLRPEIYSEQLLDEARALLRSYSLPP